VPKQNYKKKICGLSMEVYFDGSLMTVVWVYIHR
jgi:hypothetical protein